MKKIFLLTSLMIFLSITAFAQFGTYQEETIRRAAPEKKRVLLCGHSEAPIRVAGYMNYPPFGWKETHTMEGQGGMLEKDKIIATYYGIGAVLFDKFAKENQLQYQYVNMLNYDEAKYALSRGHFDILLNDYYDGNPYSKIRYFYPAYITNPIVIVVRKPQNGEKIPETLEELAGKKGLVRSEENLYDMLFRQLPKDVSLEEVNGVRRAFQALLRKETDFLIMSQLAYETEVRRFKIRDFVATSSKPFMSPFVFFSYAQENQCANFIKKEFEEKLKEYTQDPNFIRSILSSQLITWENKFMNEKSLMYEIDVEKDETPEKSDNLDDWLNKQQEEKQKTKQEKQKKKKLLF